MEVPPSRIKEICAAFSRQRIVVIGDVMLDHLVVGEARRISPEAPIPVINFLSEAHTPGGAANVARNLAALGCRVDFFGVVGDDSSADALRSALAQHGISTAGLICEPGRLTTLKSRITAQRHQVVRLDRETNRPLETQTVAALSAAWSAALPGASAVILADYAKGVVDQSLLDAVTARARVLRIPVCIDPKPGHRLNMRGCAVLTPNRREIFELAGVSDEGASGHPSTDTNLLKAASIIQEQHHPSALLITLSEAGLLLVEEQKQPLHLPTFARQVFDVTGAGDTVIATYVAAWTAGASPFEAATIANHAAGIVVGKAGTATVTREELVNWLEPSAPPPAS